jgi:uncharacterized protein
MVEVPLEEMAFSVRQELFATNKERTLPRYCRECEDLFSCFGECMKNRFIRTPDGQLVLNYQCSGLKRFYAHIDPRIQDIVRRLGYAPVHGKGVSF